MSSTRSVRERPVQLWPEPWASQAATRIIGMRGELERAVAGRSLTEADAAVRATVETMLTNAEAAIRRGRGLTRGPLDRWRGTSVERCEYFLHAARIAVVELLSEEEVDARIPAALARLNTCLAVGDVRRVGIDAILRRPRLTLTAKRAALKSAMKIGYDASDQLHQRIRGFRNILITVGATILAFMAAMVLVVTLHPGSVPMCFEPTVTGGQASGSQTGQASDTPISTRTVCPSGEEPVGGPQRAASAEDISIVAGLGLVGGALAAALAIRNLRGTSLPYDVPLALAFLKVPMGALTAVVGIILLGGGFVPGLSELDSQRQILAYALLLGYAQQVATQLIDKQAQSLLNSVPSKDPEAKHSTQPASTVPVLSDPGLASWPTGSGSDRSWPDDAAPGRTSAGTRTAGKPATGKSAASTPATSTPPAASKPPAASTSAGNGH